MKSGDKSTVYYKNPEKTQLLNFILKIEVHK